MAESNSLDPICSGFCFLSLEYTLSIYSLEDVYVAPQRVSLDIWSEISEYYTRLPTFFPSLYPGFYCGEHKGVLSFYRIVHTHFVMILSSSTCLIIFF